MVDDIQRFLLELGSGFAFYGRQKALMVGEEEFFLDLLFYHHLRNWLTTNGLAGSYKRRECKADPSIVAARGPSGFSR